MACGGGSKSGLWRQILADMFGCSVKTAASQEGAVLGVAILAGVAAGIFTDVPTACDQFIVQDESCQPIAVHQDYYAKGHVLYQQLYEQLQNQYRLLANL